jgi:Protein of unknown function (DUF3810)
MRASDLPRKSVKRAGVWTALALLAAVAPTPAAWVDSLYSAGLYPVLQHPMTAASNLVPFALFDALIVIVTLAWLAATIRAVRLMGGRAGSIATVVRTIQWASIAYLAFLLSWGLNYRRVPVEQKLVFDRAAITGDAAHRLARVAVERLNALAAAAHRTGWRATREFDPALGEGLARAARDLGLAVPSLSRPKYTLLDPYFRRAGVEGMTDPFLLETLVVGDLLPFERPFVVAHEWGHLAGLADEAAASFAGWLACLHGSSADQYSGWLFLYQELSAVLPRADREAVASALGDVPRADLAASRARVLANIAPRVSAAAWRAYDSYLKSNRVAAGTRSYDEVVQLVLGARFDENWAPKRR